MSRLPLLALAALTTATGCGVPAPGAKATVDPTTEVGLGTDQGAGRSLRRMDIDQLDASLLALTGLSWTEVVDDETVSLFEKLSGSLGKPDFKASTEEDLSPGLLFQKFLGDAAIAVCGQLVEKERTPGGERHLLVSSTLADTPDDGADRLDADLRRALLVFHGRNVEAGSTELRRWRWLFDGTYADTGSTAAAWNVVCVALITHPAFYAY
jgi:hypothetical protein